MIDTVYGEPVLPEVKINIIKPNDPVEVPLIETRIATAEASPNFVRHMTFDVSGTPLEDNIIAGQSFGVIAPGFQENGKPHKLRLYSTSSPSKGEKGEGKLVSTIVKRVIDEHWDTHKLFLGVCSNYLCDLEVGDIVKMTGPSGKRFLLPNNPGDFNYVFFATGTGIAPFRGMVLDLMAQGASSETALVFGSPYRTDFLYYDLFEPLAKKASNFHYLRSVSREARRADGTKSYVQHQIEDSEWLRSLLQRENTLIYICGLKGMETGIYKQLLKFNIPGYVTVSEAIMGKNPAELSRDDLKRHVKPTDRVFLEVY